MEPQSKDGTATCPEGDVGVHLIRTEERPGEVNPSKISALTIIGDKVRNKQGEDLGRIEEVVLDLLCGTVSYLVLSVGGFAGIGDRLIAIPLNALAMEPLQKSFILDIGKKELKQMPGFDKNDWPQRADFPRRQGDGQEERGLP